MIQEKFKLHSSIVTNTTVVSLKFFSSLGIGINKPFLLGARLFGTSWNQTILFNQRGPPRPPRKEGKPLLNHWIFFTIIKTRKGKGEGTWNLGWERLLELGLNIGERGQIQLVTRANLLTRKNQFPNWFYHHYFLEKEWTCGPSFSNNYSNSLGIPVWQTRNHLLF